MKPNFRATGVLAAEYLLLASCVILLGGLLNNHYQLITLAVPLDYYETGMLSATATIAEGGNPYSFESQPERAIMYPVLYNVIVAPLALVFGNTLPLHRMVAGIFIFLTCALCYAVARRQNNSHSESFAVTTLLYAALLYYSTPIGSPNSLGVMLFFGSICIPWLYNFSGRSLCIASILGILAFFGKQYLMACLGYIALYLFIGVSKKAGLIFGFSSLFLFLFTLGVVNYAFPYFIDNTVFTVQYAAGMLASYEIAFKQLVEYSQIYAPILVILLLQIIRWLIRRGSSHKISTTAALQTHPQRFVNILDMDAPLLNIGVNYFWFCFTCSLLVIVFVIGKNPGNHLTYLFQIMSPFLLFGCFQGISKSEKLKPVLYLILLAAFYNSYFMLSHDFSVKENEWAKVKRLMSEADDIFASTIVLAEIVRTEKEIYLTGHTGYFYLAEKKPPFFAHNKPEETITAIWSRYVDRIHTKIKAQEFDLILLDPWLPLPAHSPESGIQDDVPTLLREYYHFSGGIGLNLAMRPGGGVYPVQVWKPKLKKPEKQDPD